MVLVVMELLVVVVVLLLGLMMLLLQFLKQQTIMFMIILVLELFSLLANVLHANVKAARQVINAINALTASVKELTSKRGVIPSKRISYPYTPLDIKAAKRRRKEIFKTSSSIKKSKIKTPLSLSYTFDQCTKATGEQHELKKVDAIVEATAEQHNITVGNPLTTSKDEKVMSVSPEEWKNYPFKGFNILDEAPKI
ncbi:hypothetical protein FXO38_33599 [Capsicum annuum]|nr:hypothetical protein FXO38_33599 [Capsicum annuum]KAF3647946.1 hypothetical protein FXO37_19688 [Capsicum annuum]